MKILLLGGNASARVLAEKLLAEGFDVTLSVASQEGLATVPPGAQVLVGRRDGQLWSRTLKEHIFDVGVDGAHPFAVDARKTFREAASSHGLPWFALERSSLIPPRAHLAADVDGALETALSLTEPGHVVFLALGVKILHRAVPVLKKEGRSVAARILPTKESLAKALDSGLEPTQIVALWGAPEADLERALLVRWKAACLLCKDSGVEGGIRAKAEATEALSIPLVVIGREEKGNGLDEETLLLKLKRMKAEGQELREREE
ncbi:precorrin-6A reductase [Aminirod propionatiphilus]|uniref:Precorrin-6A reductase n=1 Tax=Aminirod propionatiphilus TaxID=3415223 RepID=A0ACD1DYP5_9BACT|nr:precorrin-6A reductase [Synergistota bacterium]